MNLVPALVYLAAATVCVPLASRFKLGSVLGYLIGGALIGPFGLALVSDPEATLHFAEFGVVLMLFAIGLELDPQHLLSMKRAVFVGGGLSLLLCSIPIAVFVYLLGLSVPAALIVGVSLGLSSTAVCMQTMSERRLERAPLGKIAFGILLFQDLAAIPLLAIVPLLGLSDSKSSSGGALPVLKAVVATLLVYVLGRYVTRPVLRWLAKTGLREVFTAFALLLVFGIAELMASVGVSMALGAFLAGVLLASSEYRHALETDIQPFKGLLMGLFFIAVGMSIDFSLLASEPVRVLTVLFGFQILKGAVLAALAPRIGVRKEQAALFSALLVQGGEFAFVVFGVARGARLFSGNWDGVLTLSVALSMALTPLLLLVIEKLQQMRPRPEREHDTILSEDPEVIIAGFGRFGQIVGRLLMASGIRATVLDHDPEQIELLRRFDFKVYYGDATRLDLLEAANARNAKVLVLAMDDPEATRLLVDRVKEHFPHLSLVARARNVQEYLELRRRGVELVERETFQSSLEMGRTVLSLLGMGRYEAFERSEVFRRHNLSMLEALLPHAHDEAKRTKLARSAREQLQELMEQEQQKFGHRSHAGWDTSEEEASEAQVS